MQIVSLAETTELAVKASRRPSWKGNTAGSQAKAMGFEAKEEEVRVGISQDAGDQDLELELVDEEEILVDGICPQ